MSASVLCEDTDLRHDRSPNVKKSYLTRWFKLGGHVVISLGECTINTLFFSTRTYPTIHLPFGHLTTA